MDRYSQAGDKVKYLGVNGYLTDRQEIEALGVKVGDVLVIEKLDIDKWKTKAKFVGIEGFHNSVMFGDI